MTKIVKITFINTGGQFNAGIISDVKIKNNLKKAMLDSSVKSLMLFDDGAEFDAGSYIDVFHVYGPNVNGSTLLLEVTQGSDAVAGNWSDVDCERYEINETSVKIFTSENPSGIYSQERFQEDDLVCYNQKIEKRIEYTCVLNIPDSDDFNIADVYVGAINLDETISNDEIVNCLFYFPENQAAKTLNQYSQEFNEKFRTIRDLIEFIFDVNENPELRDKFIRENNISATRIEGKGEWENDYIKITTISGVVLFETVKY